MNDERDSINGGSDSNIGKERVVGLEGLEEGKKFATAS